MNDDESGRPDDGTERPEREQQASVTRSDQAPAEPERPIPPQPEEPKGTPPEEPKRDHKQRSRYEYLTLASVIATSITTIVITVVTAINTSYVGEQLVAMQEANKTAANQITLAAETLRASRLANDITKKHRRPWVNVKIALTEPLTIAPDGAAIGIEMAFKNGGDAPALNVAPWVYLAIVLTSRDAIGTRRDLCTPESMEAVVRGGVDIFGGGPLLLPGETSISTLTVRTGREQFRLPGDARLLIAAFVTGCIAYLDPVNDLHMTHFQYKFWQTGRELLNRDGGNFPGLLRLDAVGNGAS